MNNLAAFEIEKEIRAVKPPKATSTYTPIPHGLIIDEVRAYAQAHGLEITRETLSVNSNGKQFAGVWIFAGDDPEFGYSLGAMNSYDKSRKFKLAVGASVSVCLNGMMRSEGITPVLSRLHTGNAIEIMKDAISKGPDLQESLALMRQASIMKDITLTPREMAGLAGEMFIGKDIINTPQLSRLKEVIRYISGQRKSAPADYYDYGCDNTCWNFYNHITAILKDSHPTKMIQSHVDLHSMFEEEFNLNPE